MTCDWVAQARLDVADRAVAARFHACALAALDDPAWPAAFEEARQASGRRDRGLLHLELACHLINVKQEAAARDALARAVPDLRGDPWAQTLVQANLGISCLRLGDLGAAERALREAVRWGEHPEGRASLSAAWRGLGGLYLCNRGSSRGLPLRTVRRTARPSSGGTAAWPCARRPMSTACAANSTRR